MVVLQHFYMSILVHLPLILLAVMFILGVIDIDDQLVFFAISYLSV